MSVLSVELADPASLEGVLLVQHLWEELGSLYGNTGPCQFTPADVSGPDAAFVLARLGRQAVGCGAIKPVEPGLAEVKRMFVEPAARRQGVGREILRVLERIARELGCVALRLETGIRQPGAIRLYETCGYKQIKRYGAYAADPLSCCFEKLLTPG